jgi:hypothetical protein
MNCSTIHYLAAALLKVYRKEPKSDLKNLAGRSPKREKKLSEIAFDRTASRNRLSMCVELLHRKTMQFHFQSPGQNRRIEEMCCKGKRHASSSLRRSSGASGLKLARPLRRRRVVGSAFFKRRIAPRCVSALSGIRDVPAGACTAETPLALVFSASASNIVMTARRGLDRTFTKTWMVE